MGEVFNGLSQFSKCNQIMKYYYEKPENWVGAGEIYICDHPKYNRCTVFKSRDGSVGLAVIQEKFDKRKKIHWWGPIEPWIAGDIFLNPGFEMYFIDHAKPRDENGLYPTVELRKIMWALRMKPLRKECWEEFG